MKMTKYLLMSVLLLPFFAQAGDEGVAKIITGFNDRAQCIAPVRVTKIDGREATVQPMGFGLEPGTHTMNGSAVIDASFCQSTGTRNSRMKVEPLEADFEAGKTYYVGFDHDSQDRNDWKLVIWKVEDSKN